MSFWDTVRSFVAREAADAREGIKGLRNKLDEELTRRERELEATPSERIEMLQEEISSSDDVFDRIEADLDARVDTDGDEPDIRS